VREEREEKLGFSWVEGNKFLEDMRLKRYRLKLLRGKQERIVLDIFEGWVGSY